MTSYPFPGCLTGRRSDAMERDEKRPEGLGVNGAEHLSATPCQLTTISPLLPLFLFYPKRTGHEARGSGFKVRLKACDMMGQLKES